MWYVGMRQQALLRIRMPESGVEVELGCPGYTYYGSIVRMDNS